MKKLLFFIAMSCPFLSSAQNVVQNTDTIAIRFGERITFKYGLSPRPDTAFFPLQNFNEDSLTRIADTNDLNANESYIGNSIQFTSFDSGVFTIPPMPIVLGEETLYTKAFQFLSIPTEVDTASNAFFDIKENFVEEWTIYDWLAYNKTSIIIAWIIILVVVLLIVFRKKLFPKKKVEEVILPEPIESFDEWMQNYILQIKNNEEWKKQDLKPFYSSINYLLRKFLEYKFSVKTLEKTSSEIIAQLRHSNINQEDKNRIIESLNLSDMVKFAKENPTYDDNLGRLSWIETFIAKHNVKTFEEGENE